MTPQKILIWNEKRLSLSATWMFLFFAKKWAHDDCKYLLELLCLIKKMRAFKYNKYNRYTQEKLFITDKL